VRVFEFFCGCDFVRVGGAVAVVWNVVEKRRFLLLSAILGLGFSNFW